MPYSPGIQSGGAQSVSLIAASSVPAIAPLDAALNALATVIIPGGTMGPNGILRVTSAWGFDSNAELKQIHVIRFGGVIFDVRASTSAAFIGARCLSEIGNRGVENSQYNIPQATGSSHSWTNLAAIIGAIDTTIDQSLEIMCQKTAAGAGAAITLQQFMIELLKL